MILSISDFFIRRPVFATVCSIVITLIGFVSIFTLPIAQYPEITPPQVSVISNYNGANAEVVESTVTNILERELNGIEGVRYITSTSANDGTSNIILTFDLGRDKDISAVNVQNRVSSVLSQLPSAVQQTGVRVNKQESGFLFAIGVYAEEGKYDDLYLSNYADLYMVDAIKRVKGVGNVIVFGERKYAMRLWLDPTKLAARKLTVQDVVAAIQQQNLQVGAGQIGQQPAPANQEYQLSIAASGRLKNVEEFSNLVIQTSADGTLTRLQDVGRAELGAENYSSILRYNGRRNVGIGVQQLPTANGLEVAAKVKAVLKELESGFPPGLKYDIAFDTTLFVEAGTEEVIVSLITSIALVVLIIFLFLQNWQASLITAIAIPVSLIGTFIFVKLLDFNINTLTLFGLTLAAGLVVDDAIVVVEDITKRIQDQGMNPLEAAIEAMNELTSAVIATSLVLIAVFVPVAFLPGTTGQLYKQFALTIAFSIVVSTFNAVTLSPTLAAILLRTGQEPKNWFFDRINWLLEKARLGYKSILTLISGFKGIVLILFATALALTAYVYYVTPTAFLPEEDQGYFITIVQAPEGVSLNYTEKVLQQIEAIIKGKDEKGNELFPEIKGIFAIGGFSFSGNTPNNGVIFTTLKPWKERTRSTKEIVGTLFPQLFAIREAIVITVPPPAILGLGDVGGFDFQLQDRTNQGFSAFGQTLGAFLGKASQIPQLVGLRPTFNGNTPQLSLEVDRDKANSLQVTLQEIYNTLQALLGSQYVNDFNEFGRTYRVYVQADQNFRSNPEDINKIYVRSRTGEMIPLSNLVKTTQTVAPSIINHYNLFRSIQITGSPAPGVSSGQAIALMQKTAAETLPRGYGYEWSGLSLEEVGGGSGALVIFSLGIIFVFLVLAAQYENYIDPLIIMLTVPLAILGALLAGMLRGFPNDVYTQIGLVMLVGMASKNAILIVEFANQMREKGLSITKAAIEASQERLRPILMTSIANIVGGVPLVIATGAGAAARQSLGTAILGGMVLATILSLFIVPVLYIVIKTSEDRFRKGLHQPDNNLQTDSGISESNTETLGNGTANHHSTEHPSPESLDSNGNQSDSVKTAERITQKPSDKIK
jgi:hydrophobic/amphiphilic exporter-1 (mainly G- bacteria), HAE1 family